ncbi:hypothetical protein A2872_02380 [Candidatus Gottesmanbacteria bacterium RIFCSPHIGHO2_01_FULL_42_12]|uniref:Uncharacterized protein n=1 Tax=Candidatus Gottesmanbacteria bacterium RIFCSPHIGHO2_01_FULL_42_12 TaxID=1798377 RepID=A0A1F5Z4Y4_9BACT|nr:MAG: hypothetical protein A2872_02380 [Candidatus Gottesmanbacteria bacterium RIFCSPHIGHO2_01_FULL_42_12]
MGKWILVIIVTASVIGLLLLGKNSEDPEQPSQSSIGYLVYQDPMYGFSIEYPEAWEIRKDTQIFEKGDAGAFGISGPTQKENTELTDGAQVAVSKPFTIDNDLTSWAKEYYDRYSEFSENTLSGRTYQKVYACNRGCLTYFYTLVNGKVYGVAVFAQGPDKDKAAYENATLYMLKSLKFFATENGSVSKEEATTKVKALSEVIDYLKRVPGGLVLVNGEEDDVYMVQVYEIKDGHTATFNWYQVDKATGEVKKDF